MKRTPFTANYATLTRRAFARNLAWAGIASAVVPAALRAVFDSCDRVVPASHGRAVLSFHMDQPYLDRTGTAMPYVAPRGMRSGAPLALLSEEAFRSAQCYV